MAASWISSRRVDADLEGRLRSKVAAHFSLESRRFPGTLPVSFRKQHLWDIQNRDYLVSAKTDGTRYLWYITQDDSGYKSSYLIDRNNEYYYVDSFCFGLHNSEALSGDTLMDGELVSKIGGCTKRLKFLIFDCLMANGEYLKRQPILRRLQKVQDSFLDPCIAPPSRSASSTWQASIEVLVKAMVPSVNIHVLLNSIPHLDHNSDGIIFTPTNLPYQHGTDNYLLKWKQRNDITVDFLLMRRDGPRRAVCLAESGRVLSPKLEASPNSCTATSCFSLFSWHGGSKHQPYAKMAITNHEIQLLGSLEGRVVECWLDSNGNWHFKRLREDKVHANHIRTVVQTVKAIHDNVSQEDLLSVCAALPTCFWQEGTAPGC